MSKRTTRSGNYAIKVRDIDDAARRKKHRPDLSDFGADGAEPGKVSKYVQSMRAGLQKSVEEPINPADPEEVYKRVNEYLEYCEKNDVKPQIVSLSLWLGVDKSTVNSWKRGEYRKRTHSPLIEKVLTGFEAVSVDLAMDGQVNPAHIIFMLKNHYGYKDNTDITIHPDNPLETRSAEDIAAEYATALPEFNGGKL